jgi:hypothetical protein
MPIAVVCVVLLFGLAMIFGSEPASPAEPKPETQETIPVPVPRPEPEYEWIPADPETCVPAEPDATPDPERVIEI